MDMSQSEVAKFYDGLSVFVTGATGFMGKVLLEKLLYNFPKLDKLYILVRPKRGKNIETRVNDITNIPLFGRIKEECPERLRKLVPVNGDVGINDLGLSDSDKERLIRDVSLVFHGAATLRLDAKLKVAINMNTEGTVRLLELCKKMPKLKVMMHVSTAFCHVDHIILEEKVYPPPADPMDMIQLCRWMDDDALDEITQKILAPHPNSYTYSKRLAEAVVAKYHDDLPCCIVRPSIVTPAYEYPVSGWVDNLNGPMGLLVGGAKGVIRSMHCNGDYHAEVIPVDMAISGMLTIAPKVASQTKKPAELPVYNLSQNTTKPVTWREIVMKGKQCAYEYPFEMMLWYPGGDIRSYKIVHDIVVLLFHWIPAYFIDFLLMLFGQKPFMLRVQQKIQDGLEVLQYFTTREWQFPNKQLIAIRESLNPFDRKCFNLDFEKIDTLDYIKFCFLGARQYLMKEDPDSLPRCRRNLRFFWLLDRVATILFYAFLIWLLISYSSTAKGVLDSVLASFSGIPFMRTVKM